MNINDLDKTIKIKKESRYNSFGDVIKEGDIVFYIISMRMSMGIIHSFFEDEPFINVYDYESRSLIYIKEDALIRYGYEINSKIISDFRSDYEEFKKPKISKFMLFIYKNTINNEIGIGFFKLYGKSYNYFNLYNKKVKLLKKNNLNAYFLEKTNDDFFFHKSPFYVNDKNFRRCLFIKNKFEGIEYDPNSIEFNKETPEKKFFLNKLIEKEELKNSIKLRKEFLKSNRSVEFLTRNYKINEKIVFYPKSIDLKEWYEKFYFDMFYLRTICIDQNSKNGYVYIPDFLKINEETLYSGLVEDNKFKVYNAIIFYIILTNGLKIQIKDNGIKKNIAYDIYILGKFFSEVENKIKNLMEEV